MTVGVLLYVRGYIRSVSAQNHAQQYGGTLSVSDDAGIFSLQVLLPKW
ncbi:hypothetical protein [Bifidobacterium callitrichidarum]|nr:hypothetical protein [Bifidobacterium callitrichidarum]